MAGYVPRAVAPAPLWDIAGWRIKPYIMQAATRPASGVDPARLAQARSCAARALADEDASGDGLGFAVLHLGEDADWLLVDWWVGGDTLAQRLFAGGVDGGPFLPVAPRPLLACVWELAVIQHERAAWIAAMMNEGGGPAAYLADRLPKGAC